MPKFGLRLGGRGFMPREKRCRPVNLGSYASIFLALGRSMSRTSDKKPMMRYLNAAVISVAARV